MHTVGAFEAKTQFSRLLERVDRGEEVVITRRGQPVARLVPAAKVERDRVDEAIAGLEALRADATLGGPSWRELRDTGRR